MSSKAWDAYEAATFAFLEAKKNRDKKPGTYEEAKATLNECRAAYRAERDRIEGTVVNPASVRASAAVNNGGG